MKELIIEWLDELSQEDIRILFGIANNMRRGRKK